MRFAAADVVALPVGAGLTIGILTGSVVVAAIAALITLFLLYAWRDYIVPAFPPPRELRRQRLASSRPIRAAERARRRWR